MRDNRTDNNLKRIHRMCRKNWIVVGMLSVLLLITGLNPHMKAMAAKDEPKPYYDVTQDMTKPDYWTSKDVESDEILMDYEQIQEQNQKFLATPETQMYDLVNYPDIVNGIELNEKLVKNTEDSFEYTQAYVLVDGTNITKELWNEITENVRDPHAETEQQVRFAICTTRTDQKAYPTEILMLDKVTDLDCDNNQLNSIRVNEPLVLTSVSKDGKYYYGYSTNCFGWVRAEDVAICESREQWRLAWEIPAEDTLVVTGDEVYLAYSNTAPETSHKFLQMGTTLKLVADADCPRIVNNRQTYYNYVVYLPVRNAEGKYISQMALISQNDDVSVGYLSLTTHNLVNQAYKSLGNTYGWGGMLNSNDCSSYMRDVYKCFGFEIPRNTSWQQEMDGEKYNMGNMSIEEKEALLRQLKPGTILYFSGHEMMYLGYEEDLFYVISATGSVKDPNTHEVEVIRSVVITSLNVIRRSDHTWMQDLTTAIAPFSTKQTVQELTIEDSSETQQISNADTEAESGSETDIHTDALKEERTIMTIVGVSFTIILIGAIVLIIRIRKK